MKLSYNTTKERFEVATTYDEYQKNPAPKIARFRWDPDDKLWWTDTMDRAQQLYEYADDDAKKRMDDVDRHRKETLVKSKAVNADVNVPVPEGLEYFPFQKAGIDFMRSRENTLLGDDMGIGKTIQLIGLINVDPSIRRALVICPATIKLNWRNELNKWLVRDFAINIINSTEEIPAVPEEGNAVYVINYDIVKKFHAFLTSVEWDLLACDEAHRLKNYKAQRTMHILGNRRQGINKIQARRTVMMTGTPIPNRPIELWSLVSNLAPQVFSNWRHFTERYCDCHNNGYGMDYSGSSNLDELQDKLRSSIMIRRTKAQVLTELPAKRRQIVEIENAGFGKQLREEQRVWRSWGDKITKSQAQVQVLKAGDNKEKYEQAVAKLRQDYGVYFTEMANARKETAVKKLPKCIEHLDEALDASEKIIIFCHHVEVINQLEAHYGDQAVSVYGATPQQERQDNVERFQDPDSGVRVFIGGIRAAGEGITLTASSHVIFVELDWVPGQISQCEDRAHRIGQENDVFVQHLVVDESIDALMAKTLVEKQAVADAALDADSNYVHEFKRLPLIPYTEILVTPKEMEEAAPNISLEQIEAVHEGLRMLAAMDVDFAQEVNGVGFSKFDVEIGHSLADLPTLTPKQGVLGQKLVNKYRRQLPAHITETAKEAIAVDAMDIDFL